MSETRARLRVPATVVRVVLLLVLALVVAPAVVADGDALAVPAVALVLLAGIAVAIVGLVYWLVTVGVPAQWVARRLHATPDRVVIAGACVLGATAIAGLGWFRLELRHRRTPLSQLDLRAAATAARLGGEHHLMETLNTVGIRSMLVLGALLVVAAIATRAFRSAALLAATVAVGGGLVELLKSSPLGPLPGLGLVPTTSTSWPSGHAALQCSLAFGVVLWWWAAGLPRTSVVAAVVLPAAVLVGYSRAFLGIHLLSDVLAGWLVAIVAAAIVVGADRLLASRRSFPTPPVRWRVLAAGIAALLLAAVTVGVDRHIHDRAPREFSDITSGAHTYRGVPVEPNRLPSADPAAVLAPLPRSSVTLLGRRALPVGLVVVARGDLGAVMRQGGWTPAPVLSPDRLPRDLWSGFASWTGLVGRVGANEPIEPTFFDARVPDDVVRRRGADAELWQLPVVTPGGCSVWAVTTAREQRTVVTWRSLFPRRRIAPTIDRERDALAGALAATGTMHDLGRFDFSAPTRGTGARGAFVTDGKVALLGQPGC